MLQTHPITAWKLCDIYLCGKISAKSSCTFAFICGLIELLRKGKGKRGFV